LGSPTSVNRIVTVPTSSRACRITPRLIAFAELAEHECCAGDIALESNDDELDELVKYQDIDRIKDIATARALLEAGSYSAARLAADYVLSRSPRDPDVADIVVVASCHLHDAERARELFR
jgi:hypothetical protein